MKAFLSFTIKFLWAMVRSWIWPTPVDNTMMPDYRILVTSILPSYDIDCAHLIAELIHKAALKSSTFIPFLCLIY